MDNDIATAPGDLPVEMIVKRHLTEKEQFRHDGTIIPQAPGPHDSVAILAYSGVALAVQEATLHYRAFLPDSERSGALPMNAMPAQYHVLSEYVRPWKAEVPAFPEGTRVSYFIEGRLANGSRVVCQDGHGFWFNYEPAQSSTRFGYLVRKGSPLPDWLHRTTIYHIFVDRFADADGGQLTGTSLREPMGGALSGITQRLPYLHDLGIGCIWLSPIGPAPSYHRYDSVDYFSIDPMLGTHQELLTLTNRAHELGIRVILDFVPSHMSADHPFFQEALREEHGSHADWFTFYDWPNSYRSFLEMSPQLPSIRTDSRAARDYLIASATHWIEHGVDGFRLDHAIGHGSDFWATFQQELTKIKPDVVTVAEATDTGDALRRYGSSLNSILDFPLARALRSTFAANTWTVSQFDNFLQLYDQYMGSAPGRLSFLDNHDMDRFLHVAGQRTDRLALAALCMLTLSQPPVIYYGTEIGMSHGLATSDPAGQGDALARQPMEWIEENWDREIHEFFRRLIKLRSATPALYAGGRATIVSDDAMGLLVYAKTAPSVDGAGAKVANQFVVALNLGANAGVVKLDATYTPLLSYPLTSASGVARDVGECFTLQGGSGLLLQREQT